VADTPATVFLKRHRVAYTVHEYDYVEHGGTEVSSRALGVPEHAVVKTLVMQDENAKPLLVLMHGDRKVSTKNLARQAGVKSIEPCRPEAAQRHSGYQIGGASPFGTKKKLPVYLERSVLELLKIYINGGRRGFLVGIAPGEIVRVLQPTLVDVALLALAFDGHADELRVGEDADLGDAHFHPRRAEIVDEQPRDALGEGLDEAEMAAARERLDPQRHLLVVDGVGHLVALEHRGAGDADLQIDGHRLRHVALARVDADERLDAQVADDDGVHGGAIIGARG
jgi:Cys-tRNA(Pro) deacylase